MAAAPLPVRPVAGAVYEGSLHQLLAGVAVVDTRFGRVRASHGFNGVGIFGRRALLTFRNGTWHLLGIY